MKFYIFGNTSVKDKEINCSAKKAAFISDDFEITLHKFQDYINEIRFNNCYLVVDFETAKKNPSSFNSVSIDNDFEKIMPFFIIGEWHVVDGDKNNFIRKDHTILTKNGFIHEFMDNATVIRDMNYCLNNHIQFTLEIVYSKREEIKNLGTENLLCSKDFKRLLVNSVDIIRNRGYGIKKFKIKSPDWISPQINRILSLYKLEKDNSDKENIRELHIIGEAK